MRTDPTRRSSAITQRGQAFLLLVLLIAAGAGALIYSLASPSRDAIERDKKTAAALAQARDALISYASGQKFTGSGERPGDLPCPDRNDNGSADDGNCNTIDKRIGRLPWKTLGIPDLRDGSGERLWYAISVNFKDNARTGVLNSDTQGEYNVTGLSPADNVIAIVFAPGSILEPQDRNPTISAPCLTTGTTILRNRCAENYLEGGNAGGTTTFTTQLSSSTFNDKLLLITSDNFFPAIEMRVAHEARTQLQAFYSANNFFPTANAYSDSSYQCTDNQYSGRIPQKFTDNCKQSISDSDWKGTAWRTWFFGNNWHHVVFYAVASKCAKPASPACTASGGLLTVDTMPPPNSNIQALVIMPGRAFTGQTRPCAAVTDCLEDTENTNGDSTYTKSAVTPTANDRLVIVSP